MYKKKNIVFPHETVKLFMHLLMGVEEKENLQYQIVSSSWSRSWIFSSHNEKIELEEFETHGSYWRQKRQEEAIVWMDGGMGVILW